MKHATNRDCREMRRRIESSIGFAVEPAELDEIERHCAACESCRAYRARLLEDDSRLAELAASHAQSIRNVQDRAVERVLAAEPNSAHRLTPDSTNPTAHRFRNRLARMPRFAAIAATAAAAVLVLVVIDLFRGMEYGSVPAFAAVQEKMQKADNVVFRLRTWDLGQWVTREEGRTRTGRYRKDYGDSIVVTGREDGGARTRLRLYPVEKRAVLSRVEFEPTQLSESRRSIDPVDLLAEWHKMRGFSFARKERHDGKNLAIYEQYANIHGKETLKNVVWVDLGTELPVRIETIADRLGPNDSSYAYGVRLNDFVTDRSKATGWVYLKPGEPCTIFDNFEWNAARDTSYFSFVPPAGYSVETHVEQDGDTDTCTVYGQAVAEMTVRIFSEWLALLGNKFPDNMSDLADSNKVKPLILTKYRRGGDPMDEFRAAHEEARILARMADIDQFLPQLGIRMHYAGKGVTFGDSTRIVCWLEDTKQPPCAATLGEHPYYFVYGDLHVATSPTPPKSAGR
ncbi:MAG: hypothetical protein PHD74_10585 [Candidatus Krumholzibacteria bacterium]|nr:hypothetical protein [Candidatus Krumholzibacteria bacterium]